MRRLLLFLFFVSCMGIGVFANHVNRNREFFREVCDLTEYNFYRADHKLEDWIARCRLQAATVPQWIGEEQLIDNIRGLMNELTVSHFLIYDKAEDTKMWTGKAIDTGIRARLIEDSLVVYRVYPDSAADDVGVRVGDEILAIEGVDHVSPWGATNRAGLFTLRRRGEAMDVNIQPRDLTPDYSPSVRALDARTALVDIPSFRLEFFEKEAWNETVAKFIKYPHVIVDIRENSGGNFVAMLRALSTFRCAGYFAGKIVQPRKHTKEKPAFDDDLSNDVQLQTLSEYRSIGMVTFDDYGCYRGRVTVLIGPETSSVSEIFAHNLLKREGSRVWGQPSAGDVVLAVWYELPKLNMEYTISIPEAIYLTPENGELEASGVYPQREMFYELKPALLGLDNWIEAARR